MQIEDNARWSSYTSISFFIIIQHLCSPRTCNAEPVQVHAWYVSGMYYYLYFVYECKYWMRFLPPRHAILKKRGGWFDGKLSTALNDEARDESPCFKTEYSCRRLLYTIDVTVFAPAEKLHACKVLRFRMYSLHPPCSHLVLRPRSGPIPSGTLLPLIGAGTQSALRRESRRRPTCHPDPIWFHVGHPYLQQLLHKHTTVLNLCAKLKEPGTCVQFVRLSAFLAK